MQEIRLLVLTLKKELRNGNYYVHVPENLNLNYYGYKENIASYAFRHLCAHPGN